MRAYNAIWQPNFGAITIHLMTGSLGFGFCTVLNMTSRSTVSGDWLEFIWPSMNFMWIDVSLFGYLVCISYFLPFSEPSGFGKCPYCLPKWECFLREKMSIGNWKAVSSDIVFLFKHSPLIHFNNHKFVSCNDSERNTHACLAQFKTLYPRTLFGIYL